MSILRADSIRDRAGTGAPDFPNGLTGNVTGNVTGTATTATLANTATVATNAQGLTGTPNITVGTVTGTDATFSGNLTVQGTTTTIDTAVTDVDSLVVDGNVGIGTTIPNNYNNYNTLTINGNSGGEIDFEKQGVLHADIFANDSAYYITTRVNDLPIVFSTTNSGGTHAERVKITGGGTAIFKAGLAEKFNNVGTTLAATTNHAITDGNVILFTGNEPSAGRTLGITGVHSILAVGESFSVTAIISPNGTGTIGGITIEGAGQTIQWSGGSAPSAGASGRDVYTFTFLKTGSANTNYEVFGAATNYA
jgi:hypothetical protein